MAWSLWASPAKAIIGRGCLSPAPISSTQRSSCQLPRRLAGFECDSPVDDHGNDASGELLGVVPRGRSPQTARIEDDDVGRHPVSEESALAQPQALRREG